MFNRVYTDDYFKILDEGKWDYYSDFKDFKRKSEESDAKYKGQPIPVTYQGMFFSSDNIREFEEISRIMMSITRKLTDLYLRDKTYRKLFRFDKRTEDLILHDPLYDIPAPMARFDIFYNRPYDFKFCEFNTDGSSAMNEDKILGQLLLETKAFKEMEKSYNISMFELFDSWVEKSLEIYKEVRGESRKVNVAIVDFVDKGTSKEFEKFKEVYEKHGVNCIIADPRKLVFRDGSLYFDDYKIDLVYRRMVMRDLLEEYDNIGDFLKGYFADAFVMVGSFRSQLVHSKLIFKILRDRMTKEILSDEENAFIERHIPKTEMFENESDFTLLKENKDKFILKPNEGYASLGVYAGRAYSKEKWKKILKETYRKSYIYQEYVDMEKTEFVVFDEDGKKSIQKFSSVIGLFIYKEAFQGIYTRIGNKEIISGSSTYYTAPNFLLEKK